MKTFADILKGPSRADLRQLQWIVALGGAVVATLMLFVMHRPSAALGVGGVAAIVVLLAFVHGLNKLVYIAWMGLGLVLGRITAPIVLGIVWLTLFVPLALLFRIIGRDPLTRRFPVDSTTFWTPHVPAASVRDYFRQS